MEKQSEQQELKDIIATREDGFGHRFKIARDGKNLSVEDVARELHLDKKIILALESEDHTQLPVAAFVCGYIRNYAKLLSIQPEPLIEYYKNERQGTALEPEFKLIKSKRPPKPSAVAAILSAMVVPVVSVLILFALLAGGWQIWLYVANNYLNNDGSEALELDGVSSIVEDGDLNDSGSLLLPEPDDSYEPASDELLEESGDSLTVEGTIPAEGTLLVEDSSPVNDSFSAEGSLPAEDSLATKVTSTVSSSAPALATTENSVTSQPALIVKNQLILEFSGDSWISIKDANNKVLSSGLKKSPKILKLDGKIPYKVFLGDARVVKVSINGKTFEHANYINEKNVARFIVK